MGNLHERGIPIMTSLLLRHCARAMAIAPDDSDVTGAFRKCQS
jgi:hypothetical protein